MFDIAEVSYSLLDLVNLGWWRTILAALALKYTMLSFLLFVAQYTLRLRWCPCMSEALRFWLYGHRLAMDFAVASLIFWPLSLIMLFDRVRDMLCSGCSLHQLLVFRDPGQLGRHIEEVRRFSSEASASNFLSGSHFSYNLHKSADSQINIDHANRVERTPDRGQSNSWSRQRSLSRESPIEAANTNSWSTSYIRRDRGESGDQFATPCGT